jgi:hypothetical protein
MEIKHIAKPLMVKTQAKSTFQNLECNRHRRQRRVQISVKVPLYTRLGNPLLSSRHNRFLLQALPCPQPQVINCIKSIRWYCEGNESNETQSA